MLTLGTYICSPVMRRIISIIFLSLLLLQAIPMLDFFSSEEEIFYTNIDEEKADESVKEKKEGKEYVLLEIGITANHLISTSFCSAVYNHYTSPSLILLTPPPDACC